MKQLIYCLMILFPALLFSQNEKTTFDGVLKPDMQWLMKNDSIRYRINDSLQLPPMEAQFKLSTFPLRNEPALLKLKELPDYRRVTPEPAFNYNINHYGIIPLNENMSILTARTTDHYYGLGGVATASASYNYRITDYLTFTGGAAFSKVNIYNNFSNELTLNSNLRLKVADWLYVNAFGSYTPTMKPDITRSLNNSMYPNSNYGGAFEFKLTDKIGVMTGIEREFDPFRGKWINRPFIMPVFY